MTTETKSDGTRKSDFRKTFVMTLTVVIAFNILVFLAIYTTTKPSDRLLGYIAIAVADALLILGMSFFYFMIYYWYPEVWCKRNPDE